MRYVYYVQRIEPEGSDALGNRRFSVHDICIKGTRKKAWAALVALVEKSEGLYAYVKYGGYNRRSFNFGLVHSDFYAARCEVPESKYGGKSAVFSVTVTKYEVE